MQDRKVAAQVRLAGSACRTGRLGFMVQVAGSKAGWAGSAGQAGRFGVQDRPVGWSAGLYSAGIGLAAQGTGRLSWQRRSGLECRIGRLGLQRRSRGWDRMTAARF